MNTLQRIILIVGAVVFVCTLLTAPQYYKGTNGELSYEWVNAMTAGFPEDSYTLLKVQSMASHRNVSVAAVRGAAVLGATIMLFFAANNRKRKPCVEPQDPLQPRLF